MPWYIEGLFWLVALGVNSAMFGLVYKFLSDARPPGGKLWWAGSWPVFSGKSAKQGLSYYIAHFGNYNKVYGALGGTIVLLIWMYYTSMIMLLGAEVTSLYRDLRVGAGCGGPAAGPPAAPPSPRGRAPA